MIHSKNGKNILFVHIPKTGGRTMLDFFDLSGFKNNDHYSKECGYRHKHPHFTQYKNYVDFNLIDYAFAVFRDPIKRMMSQYQWVRRYEPNVIPINDWVIRTLNQYKNNSSIQDNHIRPQVEFLYEGIDVYDFNCVHKIPEMVLDAVSMKSDIKVPHRFKSSYREEDVLSEKSRDLLLNFYSKDYEWMKKNTLIGEEK